MALGPSPIRPRRLWPLLPILALCSSVAAIFAQSAAATPTPPIASVSYYKDYTDPTEAYNLGYDLGAEVAAGTQPSTVLVVLAYGGQQVDSSSGEWGAVSTDVRNFNSNTAIKAAAELFGEGFYYGSGSNSGAWLLLAIGTNNSLTVSADAGQAWAAMVNDVNDWLAANGPSGFPYGSQVEALGANDIEHQFCSGTSCPGLARDWVDTFGSTSSWIYYYYGDCSGCPPVGATPDPPYTEGDYEYLSWGNPSAVPLPQIYNIYGSQAEQWERLVEYSHSYDTSTMGIAGSLTQYEACQQQPPCDETDNTAAQGWTQLWNALNTTYKGHTAPAYAHQSVNFSSDIRHY